LIYFENKNKNEHFKDETEKLTDKSMKPKKIRHPLKAIE
jgi:hypothetical protein